MKKALSVLVTFIMLLSLLSTLATVSAEEENVYDSAENGDVLYTVNFNGDPGVFEPATYCGSPDAYVLNDGASMQLFALENATSTQWGGEIRTLPLNENTQYTIFYSITRTSGDGSGLYIDGVYGVYGYTNRTKIHEGKSGLNGREYVIYADNGLNVSSPETGTFTQEFAIEVNGATNTFAHYIKDDDGNFVLIQESYPSDGVQFQNDYLGLYFYTYYADHLSEFSNCYVVKGLSFAAEDGIPDDIPEGLVNTRLELGEKTRNFNLLILPKGLDKVFYPTEGQTETWDGIRLAITDNSDPYLNFDWLSYIYKARLENVDSQAYPYVAFKLKVDGYVEDFELFYCTGDVYKATAEYSTTTYYPCDCTGEVEYIIFDLTDECEGEYNRFRLDMNMADANTTVYLYEIALFATEQEALVYVGLAEPETDATTEQETEAPAQTTEQETEAQTEATAETTEAQTQATAEPEKKGGCSSVIGTGLVTAGLAAASVICFKKKKD